MLVVSSCGKWSLRLLAMQGQGVNIRKIDLLISDIGGVLIKTDEAIIGCIVRAVRELGIPDGSVDAIYSAFGVSLKDYVRAYLPDRFKDRTDECYNQFKKIYPSEAMHLLKAFEGVDETLVSLKGQGYRLGVISCMTREEVDANLSLLAFKDFDATFSIEDYGENHRRPDPKGLLMLIERLGGVAERSIYVGDTDSDVMMAKNAGVVSVGVQTGAQPRVMLLRSEPDYVVNSFCDVPAEVLAKCGKYD